MKEVVKFLVLGVNDQRGDLIISLVHRIFFIWPMLASLAFSTNALYAGAGEDADIQLIDTLTSQASLVNKVGKSVCFLMMGADRGLLEKAALTSISQFETALSILIHDAKKSALETEADSKIIEQFNALQTITQPVMLSARQIVAGDLHPVPMGIFLDGIDPMRKSLSEISESVSKNSSKQRMGKSSVILIQQQDALIQALLRDTCLLQVGILGTAGHIRVKTSVKQFEDNMVTLLNGNPSLNIPAPANTTIRVTLEKIAKQWSRIKLVVESTLIKEPVTMRQLQKVSIFGDLIGKYTIKMRGYYWKT